MPSIGAVASSAFVLAMLTVSAAEDASGDWKNLNVMDAETQLLYKAWGNMSTYSPGVSTIACGYNVLGLQTKSSAGTGSKSGSKTGSSYDFNLQSATDYHFTVQGCSLEGDEQQWVGLCDDAIECLHANFDVYITSEPKTNTLKATQITAQQDQGGAQEM